MKNIAFKFTLITFLIVALLFNCKNKNINCSSELELSLPDTSLTHKVDIFYKNKMKIEGELNLNKLELGVDSFELRLWTRMAQSLRGQIIIIKKVEDVDWACLKYTYRMRQHENLFDFSIDTFWVSKRKTNPDLTSFISKLEKENIYFLPNQSSIPGWQNYILDGYIVYIEFATIKRYKFYWYLNPDYYMNEFSECRNIINILDLFNQEFGIDIDYK